jgi:hypothetical protein
MSGSGAKVTALIGTEAKNMKMMQNLGFELFYVWFVMFFDFANDKSKLVLG